MDRTIRTLCALAAVALLSGCAQRRAVPARCYRPQADCRVHVGLSTFVRGGPASGYLQTPTGGAAGTTSLRRPTLEEIGVTNAVEYGARLETDYRRHRAMAEVSVLELHGSGTLTEDLISQGRPFPAGTRVTSDSELTNYSLGYSYLFDVRLGALDRIELRPGIGLRAIGVGYALDGSNGERADRRYTATAPNLDLQWSWRPRGRGPMRFSGYLGQTLDFHESDPLRKMNVFEATGRANFDFSSRASLYVETGYKSILLQDTQPVMQNRIKTNFGPWVGIGGELRL